MKKRRCVFIYCVNIVTSQHQQPQQPPPPPRATAHIVVTGGREGREGAGMEKATEMTTMMGETDERGQREGGQGNSGGPNNNTCRLGIRYVFFSVSFSFSALNDIF